METAKMSGTGFNEIQVQTDSRMEKTVSAFESELGRLRTGRASTALIENLEVDYHGTKMPLKQISGLNSQDAQTLIIQPWDDTAIEEIVKSVNQSDLGLTPVQDGKTIRLSIPPLSEERRKELVKIAGRMAEEHRVSVRQIRKDSNERLKKMEKNGDISSDENKKALSAVQNSTDAFIANINSLLEKKEKEILEI